MSLRERLRKLEAARGKHTNVRDMTDAELEQCIRLVAGDLLRLGPDDELTNEVLAELAISITTEFARAPGNQ